jgi:hypothetical protein
MNDIENSVKGMKNAKKDIDAEAETTKDHTEGKVKFKVRNSKMMDRHDYTIYLKIKIMKNMILLLSIPICLTYMALTSQKKYTKKSKSKNRSCLHLSQRTINQRPVGLGGA